MNAPIAQSVRIAAELRARLAEEYQLDADDEAIDGTITGEVDLPEQIASLAREAIRSEAYAKAIGDLIKGEQNRKARLEAKGEKLRSLISWALQEAGFKRLPLPDMTLTLSAGKRPVVIDEGANIPSDFLRQPPPVLDKIELRKVLEYADAHPGEVEPLSFARLGNAQPTLTIRRS